MSENYVGLDIGTMFFQTAKATVDGGVNLSVTRNCFAELPSGEDSAEMLESNGWDFVESKGKFFVLGEHAMSMANIFPSTVLRRPLQDGVLNKNETQKMIVLAKMIESSIGKAPDNKSLVSFCISSDPCDGAQGNQLHQRQLEGMFQRLGWETKVIDEGLAVIIAENPTITEEDGSVSKLSGLGISFGAGKVNCVFAYRGVPVIGMSAQMSGDYIDQQVALNTGEPISKITKIKEKKLDFNDIDYENEIIVALDLFYDVMIKYVFENFAKKFNAVKSDYEQPLDIVIAGGTSMPKGFIDKVKSSISKVDLPFQIKDIRHAEDPRNAVVKGLLRQAKASHKRLVGDSAKTKETPKKETPKKKSDEYNL